MNLLPLKLRTCMSRVETALCQNCNDDADGDYQCGTGDPNACGACRKLAELQEKIKETRMLLSGLKRECRQLKKQANHTHDPFIHRLPPEVASIIFEFCVPDIMSLDLSKRSTSMYTIYAPLVLSAVCHKWRAIAHSNPQLWKGLPLIFNRNPINNEEEEDSMSEHLVKEWIGRAGELPISINLYSTIDENTWEDPDFWDITASTRAMLCVLDDYSDRWVNLKYKGIPRLLYWLSSEELVLPHLRTLDLTITAVLDSGRHGLGQPLHLRPTQLETLSIQGRIFGTLLDFNWNYLTQLTMLSCKLSECFEALRIAHSLTRFIALLFPDGEMIKFPLPQSPVMHAKLQYIQFHRSNSMHESVLTYLTCPSLKTLEVDDPTRLVSMSPIIHFLKRSRCSLENLSINCDFLSPADITSLCKEIPALLHLCLAWSAKVPLPPILFSHLATVSTGANEPKYLPFLQSLDLSTHTFSDWAKLPDIFGTRTSHSIERHRHALKSIKISMSELPRQPSERLSKPDLSFDIDEETLNRILWLRNLSDVKWKIVGGKEEEDMIAMAIDWYRDQ